MSVAVERRTVSLWPVNASPLRSAPAQPRTDLAAEALAAITSRYRQGRAGIISGRIAPSTVAPGDQAPADLAGPTAFPTVPLGFLSKPEPTAASSELPDEQGAEAATLWSRLVRTRRPAPRGRHSPKC